MSKVCEQYIRNRALRHLEKGRVVIVGAGSGHPYFTTDTAAAVRACELDCEVVVKATKVSGIFNKDPKLNKDAKKIKKLKYLDILNNNYQVMDSTAVTLCMDNNIPIMVLELMKEGTILKACEGKDVGSIIQG